MSLDQHGMCAGSTVYVSSIAFGVDDLAETLDLASSWGIRRIELTAGLKPVSNLVDTLKRAEGFEFLIHNYFPPPRDPFVLNLAADNPDIRTRSIDHCRDAIRLSASLGSSLFSVHAGFAAHVEPEHLGVRIPAEHLRDREQAADLFHRSVASLVQDAAAEGVTLCVENNVVSPENLIDGENRMLLMATPEELIAFHDAVASDSFGLMIDVGHVKVTCESLSLDPFKFLAETASRTRMLHLSDNDGHHDSNRTFGADAWFLPELGAFECDAIVIETRAGTPDALLECLLVTEDCRGDA